MHYVARIGRYKVHVWWRRHTSVTPEWTAGITLEHRKLIKR